MDYSRQYYDAINLVHFHFPTNWTPKFSRSYSEFFLRINNNAKEKPIHTLISNLFHFFLQAPWIICWFSFSLE